ncbi:MAG TPA: hypothetical protein PLP66_12765 [Phycisphaerae bacterium]|nr:hypothetical protein [Phycisphaerae bacterium]
MPFPCQAITFDAPLWTAVDRVLARELRRAGVVAWEIEAQRLLDVCRAAGWFPGAAATMQGGACDSIDWRELACFAWWYARSNDSNRANAVRWLSKGTLPWQDGDPTRPCEPGADRAGDCCPSFVYYDPIYNAQRAALDQGAQSGVLPGVPEPRHVSYDAKPAAQGVNVANWMIAISVFGGFLLALAGILHRGSQEDRVIGSGV